MLSGSVTGDRATAAALARFAGMAEDMSDPLDDVMSSAREDAIELAPVEAGVLVATIKATSTMSEGTVTAGEGIDYAAVQNYGWPARGIEGTHYMDAAQATAEREAPAAIDDELDHLIRLARLGRF